MSEKYKPALGSHGSINYRSGTDDKGLETSAERENHERFWRSLGKRIRKGARV